MGRAVYTIWPATPSGQQASGSAAWKQDGRWLVIQTTGSTDTIVAGPMTKDEAYKEHLRLRRLEQER